MRTVNTGVQRGRRQTPSSATELGILILTASGAFCTWRDSGCNVSSCELQQRYACVHSYGEGCLRTTSRPKMCPNTVSSARQEAIDHGTAVKKRLGPDRCTPKCDESHAKSRDDQRFCLSAEFHARWYSAKQRRIVVFWSSPLKLPLWGFTAGSGRRVIHRAVPLGSLTVTLHHISDRGGAVAPKSLVHYSSGHK